ncbi:MAG: hypothetical protein HZC40_18500 [Chloroflexi bacterium]|nr:hypothetical protein [Chloroflexota bacterium]
MLLTYNIVPQTQDDYMRFMINVFVPMMQSIGLANAGVWHTVYGNYPVRLLVFVAEQAEMTHALEGEVWRDMEIKLKTFVTDYTCRVVPFQAGFQF